MAQGQLTLFNELSKELMSGTHSLNAGGNTIKVMLIDNTTVPTASTVSPTKSDFTEVTGTGYTAGGFAINSGMSLTQVSASFYKWDSTDNPSWSQNGAGPTDIYYAVIYNDSAASDECIGFIDMTVDSGVTPISLQAGNVSITWNASGIFVLG